MFQSSDTTGSGCELIELGTKLAATRRKFPMKSYPIFNSQSWVYNKVIKKAFIEETHAKFAQNWTFVLKFEGQTKASANNFSPKLMEALQQQFRVPSMFSWSFVDPMCMHSWAKLPLP
jgi:hypothetical protein